MNKNALRFLVASALLSPATLYALGLGEIRLNSALNQPFDAEIEVVSATADELGSLKVALANDDTFRRYGLDRPNFLSNFSLRVDDASSARPVIKVRSTSAVSEPFVSLLVEVSWSGGRVLREYTILLDPPVMGPTASTAQPVQAPRAGAAVGAATAGSIVRPAQAPASTTTQAAATAPVSVRAGVNPGDSYTVKSADTLSRIANTLESGGNVSARQTMLAIYRANPQAFAGNMNVLRAGSVLRIPVAADIAAITNTEAATEISRQNGVWRNAAANAASETPTTERLRLVPAEQAGTTNAGQAGNAGSNERVKALEAQLAEAKRLLDLKNAELAQMQQRLAGGQPVGMAGAPASAAAVQSSSSASVESVTPATESVSASAQAAPAPQVEQAVVAKASDEPTASPGWLSQLSKYGLWLILGSVVLIGLLLAFFRRRQSLLETENSAETFTARDFETHLSRRTHDARPQSVAEVDDDIDEHQSLDEPVVETFKPEASGRMLSEDTLSSETAIHVDQQDAMAEADFHMAYGLYDQAADIVKLAIDRQPERRDLKLKLAEIFFVWGNKDAFVDVARELQGAEDAAASGDWDKVLIMGKQICPDDPLFAGNIAGSRSADSVDVNLEGGEHHVDIDLYDAPGGDQPKSDLDFELASTAEHRKNDDSGLDFLLDEPQRGVDDDPTRELDGNARTQETPTIESPYLPDRGAVTIREKFDQHAFEQNVPNADQTAELSLDEIGLNVDGLDAGSDDDSGDLDDTRQISDDELTRIAAMGDDYDISQTKTMLAAQMDGLDDDAEEKTGNTITVEEIDFDDTNGLLAADLDGTGTFRSTQKIDVDFELGTGVDDTAEQMRPDAGLTGIFQATQSLDVDLDRMADPQGLRSVGDTVKQTGRDTDAADEFSEDVFSSADFSGRMHGGSNDTNRTEVINSELDMDNLEPATMSEVGTKLDLARAYMDMGDPDGARSILQEVLEEGTPGQQQEAQRLLSSIG